MTVALGAGVAAVATTVGSPAAPAPTATFSLDAEADKITVTHDGGDPIAVDALRVHVRVNGDPLARQPPVPFFSSAGFRPGPTGVFNAAGSTEWTVGESASFRVAGTNDPVPAAGDRLTLRLSVRGQPVATLETTVRAGG